MEKIEIVRISELTLLYSTVRIQSIVRLKLLMMKIQISFYRLAFSSAARSESQTEQHQQQHQ